MIEMFRANIASPSSSAHREREADGASTKPLVGVVIPMLNAENTISATLESVCQQTYGNLQIIVVNDGSTDTSVSIVNGYVNRDARITLLDQNNSGVAAARNAGAATTSAQFLAFVDADDLWAPPKIELQMDVLQATGDAVGMVYCWVAAIDKDGRVGSALNQSTVEGDVLRDLCKKNFISCGSAVLMRRSAFVAAGGFDQSLHARNAQGCEDLLIGLRVAERYQIRVVPRHLVGYRITTTSMSNDVLQMCRSCELVFAEYQMKYPQYKKELDHQTDETMSWLAKKALAAGNLKDAVRLTEKFLVRNPRKAISAFPGLIRAGVRGVRQGNVNSDRKARPLYTDKTW
jgi:glycosyltransferase involved in cell wall biosynthesis